MRRWKWGRKRVEEPVSQVHKCDADCGKTIPVQQNAWQQQLQWYQYQASALANSSGGLGGQTFHYPAPTAPSTSSAFPYLLNCSDKQLEFCSLTCLSKWCAKEALSKV